MDAFRRMHWQIHLKERKELKKNDDELKASALNHPRSHARSVEFNSHKTGI